LTPTSLEKLKEIKEVGKVIENYFEFIKKYDTIRVNGIFAIVPKEVSKEVIYQTLKRGKKEKIEEIEVLPFSDETFDNFKKIQRKAEKKVAEIINRLPLEIRRTIHLAYQVKHLYESGKPEVAEEIKRKIKLRSEKMLKLCNCFCEGYIESLIYEYSDSSIKIIEEKINELLEKPIFFIHSYMQLSDLEKVMNQIKSAFIQNEDYIAIHSLGSARKWAEIIIKEISEWLMKEKSVPSIYRESSFKNEKELTKIWYTSKGERFLKLLPFYK